jgi:type IV pilus assembly protein PilQ
MKPAKILFTLLFLVLTATLEAQTNYSRIESIRYRLDNLSTDIPNLNKKVSFSISGVSLSEFIRALATNNKLNINIDPALNGSIAINFTDVTISDLLVYLSDQYSLEIISTGNIISVVKYDPPAEPIQIPKAKDLAIQYNKDNNTLSFDLQNDTLNSVIKKIGLLSDHNIILSQKLHNNLVSGYVKGLVIEKAIAELSYINNLAFSKKDSTTFLLSENIPPPAVDEVIEKQRKVSEKILTNRHDSVLYVNVTNMPLKDLIKTVAEQLNLNYFLFSELKGNIDTKLENIDIKTFLNYVFNGTDYTYSFQNGIYLVGDRKLEEIRTAKVYTFKYRTVTKILDYIPSDLKKGIELIPLSDLNSLIISGSRPIINELEGFLMQIDKVVPVVNIELIILDVANTHNVSTGISTGIDNNGSSSYATVFPTVDVSLGSNTINSILGGITGTGLVNLGKVTPGFYVSLKLSEDNGQIKIRSTPRLATLNGSQATMTIGETRYYAEQQSNVIATQNTTTVSSTIFKPLQANLAITITPIVSLDEQITLDISVEQASFTNQIANNGPYGQTNRTFKSSLRVKNNDMILLGGLEEKNDNNTGRGLPILSRIPILKWIFSSRTSNVKKSKLAILIHPTVFY